MWDLLIAHFTRRNIQFNEEQIALIQSAFHYRKFRKHQYILQQGEIARYDTFVIKGILETYLVDEKGQKHIIKFSPEDWWANDLYSFHTEQPTNYNIDCLEDSEVLQITRKELEELIERVPPLHQYYHITYRNSIIAYNRRIASSLCNTALERYQEFIIRYPQIEQRVSNHLISSYLGITPQSLSRLRKQASGN
ncbi:Crp/Fnr family transcriptional regulator [Cytophagaceae bacterium DM2B3-1]|uniref:Crp/Fnr family transcriptional regulator n=1 Tax=Xanthocytophaga flava TaxID=3048013 RepID=A0ABT7CJ80_9BACT|nr:Crp/Fnr family transcriptional regulator [Xanthocytophaga flavus]MDJ1493778.1 Crp/Fnr family transcriptional regulator [Xanthocytophaga flavus]